MKTTSIKSNLYKNADRSSEANVSPFWVLVRKEIADHIQSWRFIILVSIILLTCFGSVYVSLTSIGDALKELKEGDDFVFLKLYTVSDGSLPSFYLLLSFLGPLLGLSLGFDAINSEVNRGTISRVLAQPIPRDHFINAKFVASIVIVAVLIFALNFLMMGIGLVSIGIPPSAQEFARVVFFSVITILYIAFWLNLSIYFSIRFTQPATSALSGIATWLFFSIFYLIIVKIVDRIMNPDGPLTIGVQRFKTVITRLSPNQLFDDASTSALMPTVRSFGPLTFEQTQGAIPSQISLAQSMILTWPQLTGLVALTVLCFVFSYYKFMKNEIR